MTYGTGTESNGSEKDVEATRRLMDQIRAGSKKQKGSSVFDLNENLQKPTSGKPPPNDGGGSGSNGSFGYGGQRSIVILLIVAIFILTGMLFSVRNSDNKIAEVKSVQVQAFVPENKVIDVKKEQNETDKILSELQKARNDLEKARKNLESSASITTPSPQSKMITTFSCGENQEEEKRQGFAAMDIQNLDRSGVSYQIPVGCAWIRISTQVQNLTGSGYLFAKEDSRGSEGKMGCGTFGVLNGTNSVEKCKKFLNENLGQMIEVYVRGAVFIN